jgi:hypothetical protein
VTLVGVAFLLLESRSNGGHGDENDDQGGKSALGHVRSLGMVHVEAVAGVILPPPGTQPAEPARQAR